MPVEEIEFFKRAAIVDAEAKEGVAASGITIDRSRAIQRILREESDKVKANIMLEKFRKDYQREVACGVPYEELKAAVVQGKQLRVLEDLVQNTRRLICANVDDNAVIIQK